MKTILYVAILATFHIHANAAEPDAPLPPELAAARARHEAAVTVAVKPLRERHLQELQQLKARALAVKNLELAVAVEREIKSVQGQGAFITPPIGGETRPLAEWLPGTTWVPERKDTRWQSIRFTTGGTVVRTLAGAKNGKSEPYGIGKRGDTVTFEFRNGSGGEMRFKAGRLEFEGLIFRLEPAK